MLPQEWPMRNPIEIIPARSFRKKRELRGIRDLGTPRAKGTLHDLRLNAWKNAIVRLRFGRRGKYCSRY